MVCFCRCVPFRAAYHDAATARTNYNFGIVAALLLWWVTGAAGFLPFKDHTPVTTSTTGGHQRKRPSPVGTAVTPFLRCIYDSANKLEPAEVPKALWEDIDHLVQQRAKARWDGNYLLADKYLDALQDIQPPNMSVVVQDLARAQGGGSTWRLVFDQEELLLPGRPVLQLAHAALGYAVATAATLDPSGTDRDRTVLHGLVNDALIRLEQPSRVRLELQGRKAADAAFWFALAGVANATLLEKLADMAASELDRFGSRSSCRAIDIYHIAEKFAAAGLRNHKPLRRAVVVALRSKNVNATASLFEFHSEKTLLMIWKFSTRQRKQSMFLEMARKHWEQQSSHVGIPGAAEIGPTITHTPTFTKTKAIQWEKIFSNVTKPLVVDIGCGFGVSILGLAQQGYTGDSAFSITANWEDCNFVGIDLSGLAIGYATSLCHSWNLQERVAFLCGESNDLCSRHLLTYPGPIELCMVQFPTPFRLSAWNESRALDNRATTAISTTGNQQLPSTMKDGFMVSSQLLMAVHALLEPNNGRLLIQSNCEDVAIWMHREAQSCGLKPIQISSANDTLPRDISQISLTKRTRDWIKMGGERAIGLEWAPLPILPRNGRTETEMACQANGVSVHRALYSPRTS